MNVGEIMTRNVYTVGPPATVKTATKLMREKDVGSLVVMEDDKPVGVITERDIVVEVTSKKLKPTEITVGEIYSSPLVSISPETSVKDAGRIMLDKNIRRLPVAQEGELVGIVTEKDILRVLLASF